MMKNNKEENKQPQDVKKEPGKEITILSEELVGLKEDKRLKEEYFDALLRLQAEFDNFKKRMESQKQDFIKFANEGLIGELLHVIDDLERALVASDKAHDPKVLHKGVEMILGQLTQLLSKKGLTEIKSVGAQFDPLKHEAVDFIVTKDKPEGQILDELQKGYMLNDRVIRTSKVRVAKKPQISEGGQ